MWKVKYFSTLTVLCFVLAYNVVTAGLPTGVYVDSGVQTVRQDGMSVEERNLVEQEILTMFGVPKTPRRSPKNLDGSAPQFLFDVYKSLQHDGLHDRKPRSVSDIGRYDDHIIQDSDVIVTLYLSNHCKYTCDYSKLELLHIYLFSWWFNIFHFILVRFLTNYKMKYYYF